MDDKIFEFLSILFTLVFSACVIIMLLFAAKDADLEERAISSVHIGTVVDKKMTNDSHTLFEKTKKGYQLVIKIEYEYDGEKKTIEEKYDVERDVYLSYNVGDTFDIHNPVVKESEDSQC